MYTINKIEVFKDPCIPTAEGVKYFFSDPDNTEISYNPHEQTMGFHKQGFHTVWRHNVSPSELFIHIYNFTLAGKGFF